MATDTSLKIDSRAGELVVGPAFEFRDTRLNAQFAMGAVGGACLVAAVLAVKFAFAGEMEVVTLLGAAAAAMLAALGAIYWKFGTPSMLRLTADALSIVHGGRETRRPLGELATFSAGWTDCYHNGVYHQTWVHFQFYSNETNEPPLKYDAQASCDTVKYEELQKFQDLLAEGIAAGLEVELNDAGRVPWTARVSIVPGGIEFTKKPDAEPRTIALEQITRWEVDQGLLKMEIDGSGKPNIVEKTDQPNFYPGLALFTQLLSGASETALAE